MQNPKMYTSFFLSVLYNLFCVVVKPVYVMYKLSHTADAQPWLLYKAVQRKLRVPVVNPKGELRQSDA